MTIIITEKKLSKFVFTFWIKLVSFFIFENFLLENRASLVAQRFRAHLLMQATWVWSLGREHPLEQEMTTDSSTLAWETPWTEESGGLQSMGPQKSWTRLRDWATTATSSQLTMLCWFQVDDKGTQPYMYMCLFSSKLPSHPGCHTTAWLS